MSPTSRDETQDRLVARLIDLRLLEMGLVTRRPYFHLLGFLLEADLDDLAAAVEHVLERIGDQVSDAFRVWIFLCAVNRLVFRVPDDIPEGAARFGGFLIPQTPGLARNLWPVVHGEGGLEILALSSGYGGERYEAAEEFAYLRERYPRRTDFS